METILYKRDARNNIIEWRISQTSDNKIETKHGILGHELRSEIINPTLKKVNELESRLKAKRKEGYKALENLYDNAPQMIENQFELKSYLQTYLPKFNTTDEGIRLCMLAKTLEDNTPFEKFGAMQGQWKINGLRCNVGAEKIEGDMFKHFKLTYTSREGTKWELPWMDDIITPMLSKDLIDMMIEEGACLDGELYLPGYSVNDINSFVKNPKLPQHYKLQYWCYDLEAENMTAKARYEYLKNYLGSHSNVFTTKEEHLNNKWQFIKLPTTLIYNINEATSYRNHFISLGFEGLILRNPEAEYAFGKRNSAMFKYKKKEDGWFEIVDIKSDKRGLPIFVLKNDINSEWFDCTLNASQDKQRELISRPTEIIGCLALVEFRERSGVKQVPFHAKIVNIKHKEEYNGHNEQRKESQKKLHIYLKR